MPSLSDVMTPDAEGLAKDAKGNGRTADPAVSDPAFFEWLLRTGDNALILGHRVSEWCGHSPVLEEDIALANTALDLVGQAQMWLELAATSEGVGRTADKLAYHRDASGFRNVLLVERPNGDFGKTLMRQFLFDAFHIELLRSLQGSSNRQVAEIAEKAAKEVAYHLERSADLVIRLGDGTPESHRRMQEALDDIWPYAGEMFDADDVDAAMAEVGVAPSVSGLREEWDRTVAEVLNEATLDRPESDFFHKGGKRGRHTEHMGFLLAEMQFLQRAYPDATW